MSNLSNFVKRLRDIMRNDAGINGDAQRIEQIAWMLFLKVYDSREEDWEIDDENYSSIIPEECRWHNWAYDDLSGNAMTGDDLLDFVNNELFPTLKKLEITPATPIKKAIVKSAFEDANQYMKDGVLLRQVLNIIDDVDLSDYEENHAFSVIYESILKELQSAGTSGEFYTPRAITDLMAKLIEPKIGERMADFACGTGGFLTSWLGLLSEQVKTIDDQVAYDNSVYGIEKKQFPYMLCITNMLLHGIDSPQIYHENSLMHNVLDYTDEDKFDVVLMNPPYGGSEKVDVRNHFPADLQSGETSDLFMSVIMYRLKDSGRAAVVLPDSFLSGIDNAKVSIKKKLFSEFNVHTILRLPGSCFAPYTPIATNILFFDKTHETDKTWFYRYDLKDGKNFSKKKNPITLNKLSEIIEWWDDRHEIKDEKEEGQTETWKSRLVPIEEIISNGYDLSFCGYPVEEKVVLTPEETINNFVSEKERLDNILDNKLQEIKKLLEV